MEASSPSWDSFARRVAAEAVADPWLSELLSCMSGEGTNPRIQDVSGALLAWNGSWPRTQSEIAGAGILNPAPLLLKVQALEIARALDASRFAWDLPEGAAGEDESGTGDAAERLRRVAEDLEPWRATFDSTRRPGLRRLCLGLMAASGVPPGPGFDCAVRTLESALLATGHGLAPSAPPASARGEGPLCERMLADVEKRLRVDLKAIEKSPGADAGREVGEERRQALRLAAASVAAVRIGSAHGNPRVAVAEAIRRERLAKGLTLDGMKERLLRSPRSPKIQGGKDLATSVRSIIRTEKAGEAIHPGRLRWMCDSIGLSEREDVRSALEQVALRHERRRTRAAVFAIDMVGDGEDPRFAVGEPVADLRGTPNDFVWNPLAPEWTEGEGSWPRILSEILLCLHPDPLAPRSEIEALSLRALVEAAVADELVRTAPEIRAREDGSCGVGPSRRKSSGLRWMRSSPLQASEGRSPDLFEDVEETAWLRTLLVRSGGLLDGSRAKALSSVFSASGPRSVGIAGRVRSEAWRVWRRFARRFGFNDDLHASCSGRRGRWSDLVPEMAQGGIRILMDETEPRWDAAAILIAGCLRSPIFGSALVHFDGKPPGAFGPALHATTGKTAFVQPSLSGAVFEDPRFVRRLADRLADGLSKESGVSSGISAKSGSSCPKQTRLADPPSAEPRHSSKGF